MYRSLSISQCEKMGLEARTKEAKSYLGISDIELGCNVDLFMYINEIVSSFKK
jgi:hypothetical protein